MFEKATERPEDIGLSIAESNALLTAIEKSLSRRKPPNG